MLSSSLLTGNYLTTIYTVNRCNTVGENAGFLAMYHLNVSHAETLGKPSNWTRV